MAESKSKRFSLFIRAHSEKTRKFRPPYDQKVSGHFGMIDAKLAPVDVQSRVEPTETRTVLSERMAAVSSRREPPFGAAYR
jgi:hypothetical protein